MYGVRGHAGFRQGKTEDRDWSGDRQKVALLPPLTVALLLPLKAVPLLEKDE